MKTLKPDGRFQGNSPPLPLALPERAHGPSLSSPCKDDCAGEATEWRDKVVADVDESPDSVVPAEAGIQGARRECPARVTVLHAERILRALWVPTCAGTTQWPSHSPLFLDALIPPFRASVPSSLRHFVTRPSCRGTDIKFSALLPKDAESTRARAMGRGSAGDEHRKRRRSCAAETAPRTCNIVLTTPPHLAWGPERSLATPPRILPASCSSSFSSSSWSAWCSGSSGGGRSAATRRRQSALTRSGSTVSGREARKRRPYGLRTTRESSRTMRPVSS